MTVKELREEFNKVLDIGQRKNVGIENSDHFLIAEIDEALKKSKVDGVQDKINQLRAIFKSL